MLIEGNDDDDPEEELLDVVGIDGSGLLVGGADTVVVGAVTVVDELGGDTPGGAVCAHAPAVVVRKNTPARAERQTSPVRDLAFDSLRIIAGDP